MEFKYRVWKLWLDGPMQGSVSVSRTNVHWNVNDLVKEADQRGAYYGSRFKVLRLEATDRNKEAA